MRLKIPQEAASPNTSTKSLQKDPLLALSKAVKEFPKPPQKDPPRLLLRSDTGMANGEVRVRSGGELTFLALDIPENLRSADFNPNHALELRNEVLNSNKSGSFIGFDRAPLW